MAYASNETGRYEVWIEPLPRVAVHAIVSRGTAAHTLCGCPAGESCTSDRAQQMFRLAVNLNDPSTLNEPVVLPIKGSRRPSTVGSST